MGGCMSGDSSRRGYKRRFKREALEAHNNYRAQHGAPPLKLNGNINKYAQRWANRCAKKATLQHRKNGKYGENIHFAYDSQGVDSITGATASKAFYDEISKYNFNSAQFAQGTGHFTQLVWKNSKRMGVGVAFNPKNKNQVYAVFNYDPAGNVQGQFKENVLPRQR
ncbi:Golgi-associated plant pathogenesis-related protein 1-like [Apostichopus japonicus]|uniref:Golgi-associated plant pathogenesis-related protein 1-like n=1 Tax=Stichopus japonicus TaxID=307972 RepID=UPI003AB8D52E